MCPCTVASSLATAVYFDLLAKFSKLLKTVAQRLPCGPPPRRDAMRDAADAIDQLLVNILQLYVYYLLVGTSRGTRIITN
jgi:hypothetical protein